ncbi:hypothetical protein LR48_Vigan05g090000 [Vigna angularis]|uniref:Uncharacterized protein n=1 Tax=Phaseolus angularis TaxID=3914 RepID=A0A0L9UKS6_PHAAN|nr:hypothetical protein LR48_Vigan05g090000 [Vigna angularis]
MLLWVSTKLGSRQSSPRSVVLRGRSTKPHAVGLDKPSARSRHSLTRSVSTSLPLGLDKVLRGRSRQAFRSVSTRCYVVGLDKPSARSRHSLTTKPHAVGLDKPSARSRQVCLDKVLRGPPPIAPETGSRKRRVEGGEGVFQGCGGRSLPRSSSAETKAPVTCSSFKCWELSSPVSDV